MFLKILFTLYTFEPSLAYPLGVYSEEKPLHSPSPVSNPQAAFDTLLSSCRLWSRCCYCTSDWLLAFELER